MEYLERVKSALYVWDRSRLTILQYFSYSLLGMLITMAILALVSPVLDLEGSMWVTVAIGLLLAAVIHNIYVALVLVNKRLSDMGYDQVHLWWIFGLWLVTSIHSWGEPESTITYCLLALDCVVSLWLLFTPSSAE